jgi:hypothetical protein
MGYTAWIARLRPVFEHIATTEFETPSLPSSGAAAATVERKCK